MDEHIVLLIDGDPLSNYITSVFLKKMMSCTIYTFMDIGAALEFLENRTDDLPGAGQIIVFLEPLLPDWEDTTVFLDNAEGGVRQTGSTRQILFFVLSVRDFDEVGYQQFTHPTIKGYITKPLSDEKIEQFIYPFLSKPSV